MTASQSSTPVSSRACTGSGATEPRIELRDGVQAKFAVSLVNEPVLVGAVL